MPKFSRKSVDILKSCNPMLEKLFREVVKTFDCKVLSGYRDPKEQFELFKKGRRLKDGVWVIENPLQVVTYKDGDKKKSVHNFYPSRAVDVIPYPMDWKDTDRMYFFGGYVKRVAEELGIQIRWGGDWDSDFEVKDQRWNDLPHYELRITA